MVEVAAQARIDGNIAGLERLNVGIGGETETLEEHLVEKCGVHFDVLVCVVLFFVIFCYIYLSQIKINQFFQGSMFFYKRPTIGGMVFDKCFYNK